MALALDTIRSTADRVASSHGLEVVDVEFAGGGKHRALRVFVEKNAEGRAALARHAAENPETLPKGVPVELLSGVTHEDCEHFARDFGTVLDVEELVPGTDYTLEVSSPGLERKLYTPADYQRFSGSLVKLQTFTPVAGNRHWQGRLTQASDRGIVLDLSAFKQKSR